MTEEAKDQLIVALQRAVDDLFAATSRPDVLPQLAEHWDTLIDIQRELRSALNQIGKSIEAAVGL